MKRAMDILGAIGGILFFSPLILFLSLVVKLTSKGAGIIKLPRVGKNGRIFNLYKIRSLKNNGEVTDIGKFLRRTFLDELPQFINVLKGEMSLVGPRPEIPSIVEKYNDMQRERLSIKPGLTGLWQISPYRDRPILEHLEYDFFYMKNQSLGLDCEIILKTIRFCLTRMIRKQKLRDGT
ncbi:MAG: sugar transferase [Candidatus Omnitrophica bacterium]|nr:sugar transferase [Candidatus Omnitrophota bacterium]